MRRVERLYSEHQRNAARAQARLTGGPSIEDYLEAMSPNFQIAEWSRRMILPLARAARHKPQRICISAPPRHQKTYPILHTVAQWVKEFPSDTSAYATYNDEKAGSKSDIIRKLAARSGVEFDPTRNSKKEWRTTRGGGLLAGGLNGSGLTGEGIQGLMVVDDPFPTMKSAESAKYRQTVFDNFQSVVMTRMEGGSVIVIQTRWHEDDLIGRLQKIGGWTIINMPAIAEANDPLGRAIGAPLDPIRYPIERKDSRYALESLREIETSLGAYIWSALYQGQPRSKGHKVFGAPHFYDPETFDIQGKRIVMGCDPAASDKTSSDYSAIVVMAVEGRGPDAIYYILDVWRDQVQVPDFVAVAHAKQVQWFNAMAVVEAVAGFKGAAQALQRIDPKLKVVELAPRENKFMRAQPMAAAWKDGRVLVPTSAPWMGDFYAEADAFTGVDDAHDDQVDAAAHAFNAFDYEPGISRGSRPTG